MRKFFACLRCETKKLSLRKKYTVFSIIMAAICVLGTLLSTLLSKVTVSAQLKFTINMPMTILPMMTQFVIPLIAIMAACDLFASEYHNQTIKAQLMRPVSRFKIYLAKVIAVFLICAAIMLITFAAAAVCSLFSGTAENVPYSLGAYLLDLIPVFILILLAAALNQITKGPTSAMFLCIVVYILAKAIGVFVPVMDGLLFTSYMQWHRLWLGTAVHIKELSSKTLLLLGYGVTLFSAGYWLFLSREY